MRQLAPLLTLALVVLTKLPSTYAAAAPFLDPLKHDIMVVTARTYTQLVLNFSNRNGVTMLLHYSTEKPGDKDYINNVFNQASSTAQGMARFAAIDCATNKQFCRDNLNPNMQTPLVIVYPPSPIPPQVVEDSKINDPKELSNLALNQIVSERITTLKSAEDMTSFLNNAPGIPKLVFFSTKESAPTLLKAVANHFSDRIEAAVVPGSAPAALRKTVKARAAPSCVIVRSTDKGPSKMESYTGKFAFPAVRDWVNIHAETFVKGGGFYEEAASQKSSIERPWLKEKVPELMGVSHQDICFREKHVCAIFISSGPLSTEHRTILERVINRHEIEQRAGRGVSLKWAWLDASIEKAYLPFFGIPADEDNNLPVFLILKTKQLRYAVAQRDVENLESAVDNLVERVSSGDARFLKVNGTKLPTFAGRANEATGPGSSEGRAGEL